MGKMETTPKVRFGRRATTFVRPYRTSKLQSIFNPISWEDFDTYYIYGVQTAAKRK